MSLVIELPADLETELAAEASQMSLSLSEYVLRLLSGGRALRSAPRTGAELLAYWQDEGLIGTRADIADVEEHARALREQAQRRALP